MSTTRMALLPALPLVHALNGCYQPHVYLSEEGSTDEFTQDSAEGDDDGDDGPNQSAQPCAFNDEDPPRVMAALVRDEHAGVSGQVEFLRSDGSRFLVHEDPDGEFIAATNHDRALIGWGPSCASVSSVMMVKRETGDVVWERSAIPYEIDSASVKANGWTVLRVRECESADPAYMVFDAGGMLIDEGTGDVVGNQIRDDGWMPMFEPYSENSDAPSEWHWYWHKLGSAVDIGPSYPFFADDSTARYTGIGELVYPASIEDHWALIVERPGSPTIVPAPALEALVAQGWRVSLAHNHLDSSVSPYSYDSEWSLIEARGWDEDGDAVRRLFVLTPEYTIEEVPLTLPQGQRLPKCPRWSMDDQGHVLVALRDAATAQIWRTDSSQNWVTVSATMSGADIMNATQVEDIYYVSVADGWVDPLTNPCAESWDEAPADTVGGSLDHYARGQAVFAVPASQPHHVAPGGQCVAYRVGWTTHDWAIHDLGTDLDYPVPNDGQTEFVWFSN